MKTLLLAAALLLVSPLSLARTSDPSEDAVQASCPKGKSAPQKPAEPTAPRAAPSATAPAKVRGTVTPTRNATQRWNSFLPGMIR